MNSILNQLMFEEVKCQWSMSRPLLGLIIANGESFTQWKNDFIIRQAINTRTVLELVSFNFCILKKLNKFRHFQN